MLVIKQHYLFFFLKFVILISLVSIKFISKYSVLTYLLLAHCLGIFLYHVLVNQKYLCLLRTFEPLIYLFFLVFLFLFIGR